jgi:proline iminopeptidase
MKIFFTTTILFLTTLVVNSQTIYSKTFGNSNNTPIIFLHGGPGYNCANFEATTAQQLADKGFYVIVYDRRGEGRSADPSAQFTFKQTFDDLNNIYQQYGLTKATLIGHSFGGVVATLYAEQFPDKVQSILLVGAPVALQETFKTILSSVKTIYQSKSDTNNLNYIAMIEKMDSTSLEYSGYSFMHAMQNGFYSTKNPTAEAKIIYSTFKTDTLLTKYASKMTYPAVQGFWKNEKYTTINLTNNLKTLLEKNIKIYGLYGKEDGLYSTDQVNALHHLLGEPNLLYLDNCSHNVFVDQQTQFLEAILNWMK